MKTQNTEMKADLMKAHSMTLASADYTLHTFAAMAHKDAIKEMLSFNTLTEFLVIANKWSRDDGEIKKFETGKSDKIIQRIKEADKKGETKWDQPLTGSHVYFGMAYEFYCEVWLKTFGPEFAINFLKSTDDFFEPEDDNGTDHHGETMFPYEYNKRKSYAGSPVYIQAKATLNIRKTYSTNCKSNVKNVLVDGFNKANKIGKLNSFRTVLMTSGQGLADYFARNLGENLEVINGDMQRKRADNVQFFNVMRGICNLDLQDETTEREEDES